MLAQIPEQVTAEDVMTTTVSTVELDDTMEDALALMERIKKKGLPVVDADGNFKGAIKYKDAVKAVQQGKESQRVKAWARREALTVRRAAPPPLPRCRPPRPPVDALLIPLRSSRLLQVSPDLVFDEIENIFLTQTSGRIAVVGETGKLLGLITRTDVLRQHNLYSALSRRTK